ncbi:hypothetical protein [Vibrio phage 33Fb.4]|nr:hypothetical protein [Vibrio phage 31Fb.4]WAG58457.1 hypothetical protein [Vibrio phage 33Fb.4]
MPARKRITIISIVNPPGLIAGLFIVYRLLITH